MTTMNDLLRQWLTPVLAVAAAAVFVAIGIAAGRAGFGLGMGAIALAYAALLIALSRFSEPVAMLREESFSDERRAMIQLRATAMMGSVLATAVFGMFMAAVFQGGDIVVLATLCAIAVVTYLVSLFVLSRRT